ncbi:LOW QUALITY PROTEIN: uncharacterized protein [Argopecten irradians]|uniref:LOW QUALITY PROTEIN: uncharacterized protein n=1 Tax=Argopecten irradians TaxID=31199 RepID=UPI00371DAF77
MSQLSTATNNSCCSIPAEIILNQDKPFIDEIETVDQLYYSRLYTSSEGSADAFRELSSDSSEDECNYESDKSSDDNDVVFVSTDPTECDTIEYIAQAKFRNDTCGCKVYGGEACSVKIDLESAFEFREHCHQLTHDELDITVKAELFAHRKSGSHTQSKKHKIKERERPYQEFYFNGIRVCRTTFCFIHGISKNKLQAISKSLDTVGLMPRKHGNSGKAPHNALSVQDRQNIKTFLSKFARDNALPIPGRLPNYRSEKVLLLPSDTTAMDIFEKFDSLAGKMNYRRVSLRTFQRVWHDLCPYITVMKPCTDLCNSCQIFSLKLSATGSINDDEKKQVLEEYCTHISQAKQQRDIYRKQCTESKEKFKLLSETEKTTGNSPCTVDGAFHYSWDFAQQVHFSHHAQQVGPIFFKTPRKCSVFGICSEGSGQQVFYLVDEAESSGVGKGANSVISMVHHYFHHHGHGEEIANIHFDNCSGQNKNNIVLWYALWRVIVGLHVGIQYSMMIAGHTKFDPDWHFGVWKLRWRSSNAESLEEVARTVTTSSRSGHNIPQLVQDEEKPVIFRDWKCYLKQYFKPLKNLTKYHHFLVESTKPGEVLCKEVGDSLPVSVNLLKRKEILPSAEDEPEEIMSKGLDPSRQWYLYDNIREFVKSESSKNNTCPKPTVPKSEMDLTESNQVPNVPCKRKGLLLR